MWLIINCEVQQLVYLNQLQENQITSLSSTILSFLADPSHYDIQENLVLLSDEIQYDEFALFSIVFIIQWSLFY